MIDWRSFPDPATPGFGPLLRTWRKTQGLSQEALARLLDISLTEVARWERGERSPVGLRPRQKPPRKSPILDRIQALRVSA